MSRTVEQLEPEKAVRLSKSPHYNQRDCGRKWRGDEFKDKVFLYSHMNKSNILPDNYSTYVTEKLSWYGKLSKNDIKFTHY